MKTMELKELRQFVRDYNKEFFPITKPFKVRKVSYPDFSIARIDFHGCDMDSICPILSIPESRLEWAEFNIALSSRFPDVEKLTDKGQKVVSKSIFETARGWLKAEINISK